MKATADIFGTLVALSWDSLLAHNLRAAALEEARVQASLRRVWNKYGHALGAARRLLRR